MEITFFIYFYCAQRKYRTVFCVLKPDQSLFKTALLPVITYRPCLVF